jgi:hypothetical protein
MIEHKQSLSHIVNNSLMNTVVSFVLILVCHAIEVRTIQDRCSQSFVGAGLVISCKNHHIIYSNINSI